jgi:hypothetical protein
LKTGGTVSNTSRMAAAMKGMIMTARIVAVRMPVPKGGPTKRKPMTGRSPSGGLACSFGP